jgi:flagellar motor switch protein FliG
VSTPDQKLTGAQRVAAFLLSLDKEAAAEVLQHLSDEVIADIAEAMTELDAEAASSERVDELYVDLARKLTGRPEVRPVVRSELVSILGGSLGEERGRDVISRIEERRMQERPFAALEPFPPEAIARVLQGESPAVAALVLSHLDPTLSAAILTCYEESTALDVVRRMSTLVPPGFSTLRAICGDLVEQLETAGDVITGAPDPARRLKTIAEMLNHTGEGIERAVLSSIESENAEIAQEIRDFMFTWEDLSVVDKRAMQKILGSVNTKTLSIALKACSPEVESNILGNLSVRVRDMVAEERELAGPMPMSEVQHARDEIMQAVRALMDSGEFRPTRAGEDLVL